MVYLRRYFSFLKMPKIWLGRTTLKGKKNSMALQHFRFSYLLIASLRHFLQNLWPHLVWTGSRKGKWQIRQWWSSSTVEINSYSYPEGKGFFATSAILVFAPAKWVAPAFRFGRSPKCPLRPRTRDRERPRKLAFASFLKKEECLVSINAKLV